MEFRIGKHFFLFKHYKLFDNVAGVRSICEDGSHVLFLDLDNYSFKKLRTKLKELQDNYDVGTLYVFESSKNSYHVVSFNKFTYGEVIDIMKWFDWDCLKKYVLFSLKRGAFVLRFTDKYKKSMPTLKLIVVKDSIEKEQSKAHAKFFRLYYNQPMPLDNEDNSENIICDKYSTVGGNKKW